MSLKNGEPMAEAQIHIISCTSRARQLTLPSNVPVTMETVEEDTQSEYLRRCGLSTQDTWIYSTPHLVFIRQEDVNLFQDAILALETERRGVQEVNETLKTPLSEEITAPTPPVPEKDELSRPQTRLDVALKLYGRLP